MVVRIDGFHKNYFSPFWFRHKAGALIDFGLRILDLRNSVYYKLVERSDSTNPKSVF